MRRILFTVFTLLLIFGVTSAIAQEGCVDKASAKASGAKACCSSKQAQAACAAKAVSVSQDKEKKEDHVCPDVTTRSALMEFHDAMHPMHQALGESDYVLLRNGLSELEKTVDGVKAYKCDGYDQCSKDCRKNFDGNKKKLLNAVKDLKKACKGKDDSKVADKFNVMHEAYITFANTCVHPEKPESQGQSTQ